LRVVRLNGLVMKKFAPAAIAASACCGSELADMMTSGFTNVEQVHGGPTALQKLRGGLEVILSRSKKYVADHGLSVQVKLHLLRRPRTN
jgi:hypothetical protein